MIIAGLQVRYDSERLPGKCSKTLVTHSIIEIIIKRLKLIKDIDRIYILTTMKKNDDIFKTISSEYNISIIRGSENDVLSRYNTLAELYPDSYIIRLTGDNPFFSIKATEFLISIAKAEKYDYLAMEGVPYGTNIEFIQAQIISFISEQAVSKEDREHVTLYIKNSKKLNKKLYLLKELTLPYKLRLTLDTHDDYIFLKTLSKALYHEYSDNYLYCDIPEISKVYEKYKD